MSILRFRLWHLLIGVVVVSAGLFGATEYGMETAEIEVLRFDAYKSDNASMSTPALLTLIEFQYLRPNDQKHISGQVHLRPIPVEKELEVGQRFVFRYRAKPLLWLKQINPNDIVLKLLGMREEYSYQVIIESGDREI